MAWTAPMTAVDGQVFTAAQFNANIRDNLLETSPAKATTASGYFVATGANALAQRIPGTAAVNAAQTLSIANTFTDLATVGPTVTVTTGPSALVFFKAHINHTGADIISAISYNVTGASSIGATFNSSAQVDGVTATQKLSVCGFDYQTGLTPGVNTFTMKYWTNIATATFELRELAVFPY